MEHTFLLACLPTSYTIICLSTFFLITDIPAYQPTCLPHSLPAYLPTNISTYAYTYLHTYYIPFISLPPYLPIRLTPYLSIYCSIYLPTYIAIDLPNAYRAAHLSLNQSNAFHSTDPDIYSDACAICNVFTSRLTTIDLYIVVVVFLRPYVLSVEHGVITLN